MFRFAAIALLAFAAGSAAQAGLFTLTRGSCLVAAWGRADAQDSVFGGPHEDVYDAPFTANGLFGTSLSRNAEVALEYAYAYSEQYGNASSLAGTGGSAQYTSNAIGTIDPTDPNAHAWAEAGWGAWAMLVPPPQPESSYPSVAQQETNVLQVTTAGPTNTVLFAVTFQASTSGGLGHAASASVFFDGSPIVRDANGAPMWVVNAQHSLRKPGTNGVDITYNTQNGQAVRYHPVSPGGSVPSFTLYAYATGTVGTTVWAKCSARSTAGAGELGSCGGTGNVSWSACLHPIGNSSNPLAAVRIHGPPHPCATVEVGPCPLDVP